MRSKSITTLTRIFNAVYNQSHKLLRSIARLWTKWCSLYKRHGVNLLPGVSVVLHIGRRWISRMTTTKMIIIIIVMRSRWVTTILMATIVIIMGITLIIQPTIQQTTITWTHWIITWQNQRICKDHNVMCLQYRSSTLSLATRAVSPKRDKKNLSMVTTTIYTITIILIMVTTITITMITVE